MQGLHEANRDEPPPATHHPRRRGPGVLVEGPRVPVGRGIQGGAWGGAQDAAWERDRECSVGTGPGWIRDAAWERDGDAAVPSRAFSRTVLATMFSSSMAGPGAAPPPLTMPGPAARGGPAASGAASPP